MTLENLKLNIENKTLDDSSFLCTGEKFIFDQYVNEIKKFKNYPVRYIQDIFEVETDSFFGEPEKEIKIYYCDECNDIPNVNNLYVFTKKSSYKDLIKFPKLEKWQLKDFSYSSSEGVKTQYIDELVDKCKDNYKLASELDKIRIFSEIERKYVFDDFISDDIFSDMSPYTMFDFKNAILSYDVEKIIEMYKHIDVVDVEPLGLVTILYNEFKNYILCCMQPHPTEENTGIKDKDGRGYGRRIYAIKNSRPKSLSDDTIIKLFKMLSSLDFKMKNGDIPETILVDYIITNILMEMK